VCVRERKSVRVCIFVMCIQCGIIVISLFGNFNVQIVHYIQLMFNIDYSSFVCAVKKAC